MKRRRGYTLIELVFVCTLTTTAVMLGCQTLLLLYRTEENVRDDARLIQVIARLGREFRTDAHAAGAAEVGGECRLTMSDGRDVVYVVEQRALQRRVERDGKVVARESFALPRGGDVKFTRRETNGIATLGLEIVPADNARPNPLGRGARPWSVETTLGLHSPPAKEGV